MKDIAREAGVALSTVSNVLNRKPAAIKISEKTQTRIFAISKQLNYVPNVIARGLSTGRSMQIGLLTPRIEGSLYPFIVQGIEDVLNGQGYSVVLCMYNSEVELKDRAAHLIRKRVGGILIIPRLDFPTEIYLDTFKNLAAVTITGKFQGSSIPCVKVDGVEIGYQAVKHLLELGHRNIAICDCGELDRREGAKKALREFRVPSEHVKIFSDTMTFERGREIFTKIIDDGNITGVYAYNDQAAAAMIYEATSLGIKIPERLSIVGANNMPISTQVYPRISTVCQPKQEQGAEAAKMLLDMINNNKSGKDLLLRPELIVRSSTTAVK